jgi:hypothetical protein
MFVEWLNSGKGILQLLLRRYVPIRLHGTTWTPQFNKFNDRSYYASPLFRVNPAYFQIRAPRISLTSKLMGWTIGFCKSRRGKLNFGFHKFNV